MNLKKVALGLVVVSLALGVNQGFNVFSTSQSSGQNNKKMDNSNSIENIRIDDSLYQPKTNWGVYREKIEVKGIFLTAGSLATTSSLDYLLGIVNDTEINSMVIDVKNDAGTLTYESSAGIKMGIDSKYVMNYERFLGKMETLLDNDVYPIARIVTFKDRQAGAKRPDIVFKDKNGNVWRDNNGNTWLNPFNKESWEYPIRLAEEAALNGFKEIQFDYVRFPTDGNTSIIDYGNIQGKTKEDAIAEFLSYAKERLEPLGVYVSADVFGHIINVQGGAGIGQDIDMLATSTDILSPMVYPSHYNKGSYGVAYPDADPYTIVNEAMKRAINRVNGAEGEKDDKAIIRPWLQDFSATWLRNSYGSHYTPYGPEQVRAQIQATYDAGLKEWILWNASNRYTLGALYNEDGTGGYTYDPNAAKATFKPKNTDNKSTKQEDTKQEEDKSADSIEDDSSTKNNDDKNIEDQDSVQEENKQNNDTQQSDIENDPFRREDKEKDDNQQDNSINNGSEKNDSQENGTEVNDPKGSESEESISGEGSSQNETKEEETTQQDNQGSLENGESQETKGEEDTDNTVESTTNQNDSQETTDTETGTEVNNTEDTNTDSDETTQTNP